MENNQETIVSSYFFYMWNAWGSIQECEEVFGNMSTHFWDKWNGIFNKYGPNAAEKFYSELSTHYRQLLVNRACELYSGSAPIKILNKKTTCNFCGSKEVLRDAWVNPNNQTFSGWKKYGTIICNSCGKSYENVM